MYKEKDMEIIITTIESLDLKKAKELIKNYDINYILSFALYTYFNELHSNTKAFLYIKHLIKLGANINNISKDTGLPLISEVVWIDGYNPEYEETFFSTEKKNWRKLLELGLNINTKWEYRENEYSIFYGMVNSLNSDGISYLIENGLILSDDDFVKSLKYYLSQDNGISSASDLTDIALEEIKKLIVLFKVLGADFTINNNEAIKLMLEYEFLDIANFMIHKALEEASLKNYNEKTIKWLEENKREWKI